MAQIITEEDLNKFKEICNVDDDQTAINFLNNCGNDVNAAVQLYFQTSAEHSDYDEQNSDGSISRGISPTREDNLLLRRNLEVPAGQLNTQGTSWISTLRLVLQPWRRFLIAIAAMPLNFLVTTAYDVLHYLYECIFGERRLTVEDVRRDVDNFIRDVDERFGRADVFFVNTTFNEAFVQSCDSLKVLVICLFSPGDRYHEETVRRILEDNDFASTVNFYGVLLWGVDPRSRTGRDAARRLSVSAFPCFITVSPRDDMMTRIEQPTTAEQVYRVIREYAMAEIHFANQQESRRRRLHENRELMRQQEKEYRESEERDRIMMAERRRQEELEKIIATMKAKEEEQRKASISRRAEALRRMRNEYVASEIEDYDGKDAIRVIVRYPSGQTNQHRFSPDDSTAELFKVVFSKSWCPDYFEAHYGFPRVKLDFYTREYHAIVMEHMLSKDQNKTPFVKPKTFKELGIDSSLALYVSDIDS